MTPYIMDDYAKRYLAENGRRQEPNGLTVGSFMSYAMSNAKRKEYGTAMKNHIEKYCIAQDARLGKSSAGATAWYPALQVVE
jgi:hypothetical protein